MLELNKIHLMDALSGLKLLADESVNCCVTSPPYWNVRDYGTEGQIGLEEKPEIFIEKLVEVFREVKRVLKSDGSCWINIGDSYANGARHRTEAQVNGHTFTITGKKSQAAARIQKTKIVSGLKAKDLVGVPWMLAFALRADGWYLRQEIIWSKPNPMPESVTDRFTKSHEQIFLLTKSPQYYFDQEAILEPVSENTHARLSQDLIKQIGSHRANGGAKHNGPMKAVSRKAATGTGLGIKNNPSFDAATSLPVTMRNKRSVWTVTTRGFSEAHFATFPEQLIVPCIKAGSRVKDTILDPFMGAGTTALVARSHNRNFIGFEINPEYRDIAEKRLYAELGMFAK